MSDEEKSFKDFVHEPFTDAEQFMFDQYVSTMHAVQSAVNFEIQTGQSTDTTPKHLRVGVNSAMVDTSALVHLLIKKGVFTRIEWLEAINEIADHELSMYEQKHAPVKFR